MVSSSLLFTTLLVEYVLSHGIITQPKSRAAGPAMQAVCGQQVTNQQTSDVYGNIQGELQIAQTQKDYDPTTCNFFLCKGFQLADNTANVQSFALGEVVPITVDLRAPHTGTCNVSIVNTKTNTIIGDQLISFSGYASTAHPIPANNTQFSITMPSDLGGKCTQPGDCVIQWFWDSPEAKQTYESCIDFTVSGSTTAQRELKKRQEVVISKPAAISMSPLPMSGSLASNALSTSVPISTSVVGKTSSTLTGVPSSVLSMSVKSGLSSTVTGALAGPTNGTSSVTTRNGSVPSVAVGASTVLLCMMGAMIALLRNSI